MYDGLKNLEVPRKRRHPGARRAFKFTGVLLLVFAVAFGFMAWRTYNYVNQQIDKGKIKVQNLDDELPNGPINILVLGSDRRDVIEGTDRNTTQFHGGSGQRADTIFLIHVAADKKTAVLMNFPRDLRVTIPGHGRGKINSAYSIGGPNLMIKTIEELSGISLNHFVEINFASFQKIVNAVGGIDMLIPKPLHDRRSGLDITQTGCVHLDGATALALVRARYIYPTADFGRIQTQQRFMRALLHKVKGLGFLLNFKKVSKLAEAIGAGVLHDPGVKLSLAQSIANKLSGFDSQHVDFRVVPNRCCTTIGGQSYVLVDELKATAVFSAMRADKALPPYGKTAQSVATPDDVTIRVVNATGVTGLATREVARLKKLGFHASVDSARPSTNLAQTAITYSPDSLQKAKLVRGYYPTANLVAKAQRTDIILRLGRDVVAKQTASPTAAAKPKDDGPALSCG